MMNIISCINQKGGVGKSSSSISIAFGVARELPLKKVILVDLDSQCNTTQALNINFDNVNYTIHDVLIKGVNIKDALYQLTDNVYVVCGSPNMAHCDMELTEVGKEYKLKECLQSLEGFADYLILDNPPALNTITINSMTASNYVLIPCQADVFSLDAMTKLNDTINTIRTYTNPGLKILGVLLTRYSKRSVLTRQIQEVIDETAKAMGTKVYGTIREAIALKESQAVKQDIFTYNSRCGVAKDYMQIVKEVINEIEKR